MNSNDNIFIKINNIVNNIIDITKTNINSLLNYDIDEIINLESQDLLYFINNLIQIFKLNYIYSYKYTYYEPLINLIITIIIKSKKYIDLSFDNYSIINSINLFKNSHLYLKKIRKLIVNNNYININILSNVCHKSTLPTFLFWWDYFKNTIFSQVDYLILVNTSIINSDDRIFKFLLNISNVEMLKDFYKNNGDIIVSTLLKSLIPKKFKLKRIKLLSSKCDLSKFYNSMINNSESLKVLNTLTTYYYKDELSFDNMINIFNKIDIKCADAIIYYNSLKTIKEKNYFCILCNLNSYYNPKIKLFNNEYKILIEHYIYILSKIECNFDNMIEENNIIMNSILKYYIQTKCIDLYINNNSINNIRLYRYTRFFVRKGLISIYNIHINRILHLLRCYMKRRFSTKHKNFSYSFKPVLNEINNFIPNNKYSILKKGSNNYQLKEQEYNLIPPRHLLPLENILNNNFLIKEKADGILMNILPIDTFPNTPELNKYEIKAEFIEALNLYLIFDINIPNSTIYERQIFLRNLHYMTQNKIKVPNVKNFDELVDGINLDRAILETFIELNFTKIKWYPKCSWKILMDQENYNNITNIISGNSNYFKLLNYGIFNIDGFILTPLNGSRELKVKPRNLLTIDLLFNGKNWLDSDNNIYPNIEMESKKYKNKVYRCYPINNKTELYYMPHEIRYDKRYPNSKLIIEQLMNIYNFNWDRSDFTLISGVTTKDTPQNDNLFLNNNNRLYYENKNINKVTPEIISIISNHQKILDNLINFIKPELNKNWLDLGCGKCKLFKNIKTKYYPKKYLGIDNDVKILSELFYLVDKNSDNFNIYPTNLNNIWDQNNIWNNFNWKINYNYIIANFSLMHFCNDTFWTQLNNIVCKGSKFIFNIVKENSYWENNNSYLKSNNESTVINFEWTHNKEMIEPLIKVIEIQNYIKKYNWKIIIEKEFNDNELTNCYKWFIIEKI